MGKGLIAFLLAISGGTWIYSKFMRSTGSLTQRSVTAAGVCAVVIFLMAYLILGMIGF